MPLDKILTDAIMGVTKSYTIRVLSRIAARTVFLGRKKSFWKTYMDRRHGSVVEHATADREVPGSKPARVVKYLRRRGLNSEYASLVMLVQKIAFSTRLYPIFARSFAYPEREWR